MILTLVAGIIVLSVLVIIHELGHFIAAKATGVWVEEFGIGFPPRLYGRKFGETIYSINWIPFGGFNKLSGEVDPSAPRALAAKSHGVRLLVLAGGIILNLLLPFILLAAAYMFPHDILVGQVEVQKVYDGSAAAAAGIEPGDTILAVDGNEIKSGGAFTRYLMINLGRDVTISVEHADATKEDIRLTVPWRPTKEGSLIGTSSETKNPAIVSESYPFWRAVPKGAADTIETLALYKNGIIGMVLGTIPFIPAGPVGIVQVTGEVAHSGISPLLELTAFISIAIGITQIIPFPALDGGRILFVLIEWVRRGKRVSPKVEGIIHSIGFVILLAFLVLVTYQDIFRWVSGGSLIP